MKRSVVQPAATGLLAALCVLGLGLATASPSAARAHGTETDTNGGRKPMGADLLSYKSCAQLLSQVKTEALKEVGPYGLSGPGNYLGLPPVGVVRGAVPMPTALEPTRPPPLRRPQPPPLAVLAPAPAPATPAIRPPTTRKRASMSLTW